MNANGMSDIWERHFNQGALFDPSILASGDEDGDGQDNLQESIAGTDPFEFNIPVGYFTQSIRHVPEIWYQGPEDPEPLLESPEVYEISWFAVAGKKYTLHGSTDLVNWVPITTENGEGETITIACFPQDQTNQPEPRFFWRVEVEDIDYDGDGLTDYAEMLFGSDPNLAETYPGVPDSWLATHYQSFSEFDPHADDDNDGLSNLAESQAGTNPHKADTDGDGLTDAEDADPLDKAVNWQAIAESSYAIIPLENAPIAAESEIQWKYTLADGGYILASRDRQAEWTGITGVPDVSYFETKVWNLADLTWHDLSLPANLRGIGTSIDQDGNVYGIGFGALGAQSEFPGSMPASFFWQRTNGSWATAAAETGTSSLGAAFSNLPGTRAMVGWPLLGAGGGSFSAEKFVGPLRLYPVYQGGAPMEVSPQPERTVEIRRSIAGGGAAQTWLTASESSSLEIHRLLSDRLGWHYVHWEQDNQHQGNQHQRKLFGLDSAGNLITFPVSAEFDSANQITAIVPELIPTGIDQILVRSHSDSTLQVGTKVGQNSLQWQTSTRPNAERIGGIINARGEGLDPTSPAPRLWRNGKWKNLIDLLPANHSWSNLKAIDINSDGLVLIEGTKQGGKKLALLLPVEFEDINDHADESDDVAVVPWDTSEDIATENIAWIEAHTSDQDTTPRMPQLEFRVPKLLDGLAIEAKLEVKYERGNGARHPSRTDKDGNKDTVKVPENGDFVQVNATTWEVYNETDWQTELADQGFFGGDATLTYQIKNGADIVVGPEEIEFRIGGENPEHEEARNFIESLQDADPQGDLWFAYAIAKAETMGYNNNGSDENTRYNHFLELPGEGSAVSYRQRRTEHAGRPLWNDDGGTLPSGYGLFQVTGNADEEEANIPRRQIWNWQDNARGAMEILRRKHQGAELKMQDRRQEAFTERGQVIAVPNHSVPRDAADPGTMLGDAQDGATTNPTHTFGDADIVGAVTMKRYNGAAVIAPGATSGTGDYCVWRNQTQYMQGRWEFRRWRVRNGQVDQVSYVDLVAGELEEDEQ